MDALWNLIGDDLPALQIAMPLLTATVCVIVRRPMLAWAVAMFNAWGAVINASILLYRVWTRGTISYVEGGWPVPWGIELRIDLLNALVLLVVTGICAIVLVAVPRSIANEIPREKHYLFYAAYLLCMTGLAGMTITGDAFNIFVFLEISSLSSYALISQGRTSRALTSAIQYLIMGTLGGTFILLGIGMLYMMTGTLNLVDMADQLALLGLNRTVLVAMACLGVGIGIKLAVFPLHTWLPNAYTYAPAVVTAFLAATATKVAYYVLVRFAYSVFRINLTFDGTHPSAILMMLGIAAMFAGSLVAIYQDNVKRMLAYSSVAQIGYMVLGLSLGQRGRPHRGPGPRLQSRHHEVRALPGARVRPAPDGLDAAVGLRRARPPDAPDLRGLCPRWSELDRRTHDGGFRQQVVSRPRRPRSRAVAGGGPDSRELDSRAHLYLAGG